MPTPQQRQPAGNPAPRRRVCKAVTGDGSKCKRQAVAGLTVCASHGGGTTASVRAGKRAVVAATAGTLWGIVSDAGSLSIEHELRKLAQAKLTDILAIRIELSKDPTAHIGMLVGSREKTSAEVKDDVYVTVKQRRVAGVSPWVAELHRTETELVAILKLLHEITGGTEEVDTKRLKLQTARETARLMRAFPGMSIDDVAASILKAS